MRIIVRTTHLLIASGPILCGLLLMSCARPPRAQSLTTAAQPPAAAAKPELGKEYPSADEAAQIKEISDLFTGMSERKYPANVRPMRRDAHTKAHGCVKAEFTVPANVPDRARVGLFSQPSSHQAWIRFSNAFSSIEGDDKIDVRGMAVKVMGVEGEKLLDAEKLEKTQDFLMINTSVFFSPNVTEYLKFSREYVKKESTLGYVLWPPSHWPQGRILYRAGRGNMTNPLTSRFWSSVPFKLGTAAIKYSAKPCAGIVPAKKGGSSPEFLREAMAAYLRNGEGCFDFTVQFQTDPVKMPVEDPSVDWDEAASPFITVAKLTIPKQTFDSDQQMAYCEALSFTPWHSLPEHQPIGGVNRIRKVVYERSSTLRHTANNMPRREPNSFADFTDAAPARPRN
jgi:hypothetical protein